MLSPIDFLDEMGIKVEDKMEIKYVDLLVLVVVW